ncbi:MAG: ATP-binding protein [Syntrophales bacterium]|jgi:two-component system NtrC family sensor kinase|nr:ATP-binding protein [Syntrophales bacterium]
MRISLISKLAIITSLILLVFMVFFAYINIANLQDMLLKAAISDADKLSETIIKSTHYEMLEDNRNRVYEMIQEVGTLEGVDQIRMINKSGHISFSTKKEELGRRLDKKEAGCNMCHTLGEPKVHASTMNRSRIFFDGQGRQVLGMAKAIYNEKSCYVSSCHFHPPRNEILGVLDIVVSLENMHALIRYYRNKIIVITVIILLSILLAIVFFTNRLVNRPLKNLLVQTKKIAVGNLDAVVENSSRDEVGELSDAFNKMTANLKTARRELEEWGKNLEAKVAERTNEIKQMQARLVRSEKLVSLGRLVAGITHEINNPLTGILMYADLAIRNPCLNASAQNDLNVILKESQRCAKIVRSLLSFSRESIPQKKPSSLNSVMDATIELVVSQASFQNIEIARDYQPDLPLIPFDENQMEQVFINILLNASQSMEDSGRILIRTYTDQDECVSLKITDTGAGIAEDDLEKIFDPFFTTKGEKGTGLGLSISYGIIERHGGKIEVQSTIGKGTTFVIKLPLFPQGTEAMTAGNPAF